MAHARRKIHDLHARKATPTTTEILRRIGELYAIESQIRGQAVDDRRRIRELQARPRLDALEIWLRQRLLTLSTQSETTKAINYMLNQWQALIDYCDDDVAEIDNNIAENALRLLSWPEECLVLWGRQRRRARRRHVRADRFSAVEWSRPRGLPTPCLHAYRRLSDQPCHRSSAMECRRSSEPEISLN